MDKIFFESWESLGRTFIITILAYVSMIIILRTSGKRTLSKMNAFDFVVTIALGSSLATVVLNKGVTLSDGVLAFVMLVLLQFMITWVSVRVPRFRHIITNEPRLLVYKGEVIPEALKKERITREEIEVAARKNGISSFDSIDIVVLETTGDLTVIGDMGPGSGTMKNVKGFTPKE